MEGALTEEDYQRRLGFRTDLRRFLRWSEQAAAAAGVTPAQHQPLLAIRGNPDPSGPTIGDVADALLLRHHRARRTPDASDHRVVRLALTPRRRATPGPPRPGAPRRAGRRRAASGRLRRPGGGPARRRRGRVTGMPAHDRYVERWSGSARAHPPGCGQEPLLAVSPSPRPRRLLR